MTEIQFKGENCKIKNIIKVLEDFKLSGIMPTVNYISYWDNTVEESFPAVELKCRDERFCNIPLTHRDSSQSEDSMAMEGERKTARKRNAPHRLIEDDKVEAGNVLSFMFFMLASC